MKRKNTQRKRLTIEDHMFIQACIHQGMNITEIASRIGVNKSTISREINKYSYIKNGNEFSYFNQIEIDNNGEKICSTYFTNPYKSTDKAECERLLNLVRYFLPKGKSLNSFNQEQVNEMFSHINNYIRESKKDKTPYDMVLKKFGKEFLDTIGIRRVPNKLVVLKQII